jgi:hypothetical protein
MYSNRYFFAILFYFACFSLFSFSATAQVKKGLKAIKKNQYELAKSAFEVDLENENEITSAQYYLAELYANPKFEEGYDLALAYAFIEKAILSSHKATPKARKNLDKRNQGLLAMRKFREEIINTALDIAEKKSSAKAYNELIRNYTNLNAAQTERVARTRNRLAFEEATATNSASAWQIFWKNYKSSCSIYSPDLHARAEIELFGAYIRQNTWRGYAQFTNFYPESPYTADSAAAIKMQVAAQKNTMPAYKSMIEAYPKSVFAVIAIDSLFSHTLRSQDALDYDYFIHTYPAHSQINTLYKAFFPLFCKTQGGCPDSFYSHYKGAPK